MDDLVIEPVSLSDISAVYPQALRSLFWEHGLQNAQSRPPTPCRGTGPNELVKNPGEAELEPFEGNSKSRAQKNQASFHAEEHSNYGEGEFESDVLSSELEKEAWINTVFLSWGQCGYSLRRKQSNRTRTVATLFFAPPRFCPTTFSMPSGPISPDAIALTSLHFNPIEVDQESQRRLIEAALSQLARRGVRAVEAFGCSSINMEAPDGLGSILSNERLLDDEITLKDKLTLNEEGAMMAELHQQLEDSVNPQPCHSDALGAINHDMGDVIKTRVLMSAGFTVVTPHPVHPKLRIELDAELDWNEAVGEALNRHVAEQIMQAENYSSFSASRS